MVSMENMVPAGQDQNEATLDLEVNIRFSKPNTSRLEWRALCQQGLKGINHHRECRVRLSVVPLMLCSRDLKVGATED